MSFKGLLNKTCTIQSATYQTAQNSGQQTLTYSNFLQNVPCRLRTRDVQERRYSNPAYQKATHSLYLEEVALPQTQDLRIVIANKNYSVKGQISLGGQGKYLCLYLERIV